MVVILMGSLSDWGVMRDCVELLKSLRIPTKVYVSSAHRSPIRTHEIVKKEEAAGAAVFIGAAGMAAHLAGSIASITTRPVIAVPLAVGMLDGLDSLLSTVQMPRGVPVATMSLGRAGALNAAYFSAQILCYMPGFAYLAEELAKDREKRANQLIEDTKKVQEDMQDSLQTL